MHLKNIYANTVRVKSVILTFQIFLKLTVETVDIYRNKLCLLTFRNACFKKCIFTMMTGYNHGVVLVVSEQLRHCSWDLRA